MKDVSKQALRKLAQGADPKELRALLEEVVADLERMRSDHENLKVKVQETLTHGGRPRTRRFPS